MEFVVFSHPVGGALVTISHQTIVMIYISVQDLFSFWAPGFCQAGCKTSHLMYNQIFTSVASNETADI